MFDLKKKQLKVNRLAEALRAEGFVDTNLEVEIRHHEDWGYDFWAIHTLLGTHAMTITVFEEEDKLYMEKYDCTIHIKFSARENLGIVIKTGKEICTVIESVGMTVYLPELGYEIDDEEEAHDTKKKWWRAF